ncbi:MAG TPA: phage head-tail connector protein [Stellaceae bacterium]|nr:phage head-tail connector protein [Stellaceae bacterium]
MSFGDLCQLSDVKAWLQTGQNAFPATDDALLSRLITAASQFIQSWLGRQILLADYNEIRDGLGTAGETRLQFACFPVSAVLSVMVDGVAVPPLPTPAPAVPGGAVILPTTVEAGYVFNPTQLVIRGMCVPRKAQCVALQYTAGYAAVPADLGQACIELVAFKYRERTRIGERSRTLGGGGTASYTTAAFSLRDLSTDIQTLLSQYRAVAAASGYVQLLAPSATDPALLVGAA